MQLVLYINLIFLFWMEADTYAVVDFVDENAVEVVVKNWIEKRDGVSDDV